MLFFAKIGSVRTKTLLAILPLTLSAMLLLAWISYYYSYTLLDKEINNKMNVQFSNTTKQIENRLTKYSKIAELLARIAESSKSGISKEQYAAILNNTLTSNSDIFGNGIWFEPYRYKPEL